MSDPPTTTTITTLFLPQVILFALVFKLASAGLLCLLRDGDALGEEAKHIAPLPEANADSADSGESPAGANAWEGQAGSGPRLSAAEQASRADLIPKLIFTASMVSELGAGMTVRLPCLP